MINFKKELIEKRKVLDEKVAMYNAVIKENSEGIKDLFKSSCLLVETEKVQNNSISLKLRKYEGKQLGWTSKDFTYDYAINKLFCSKTSSIENALKKFILDIAQEIYIEVEQELQSVNKLIDNNNYMEVYENIEFIRDFELELGMELILLRGVTDLGSTVKVVSIDKGSSEVVLKQGNEHLVRYDENYIKTHFGKIINKESKINDIQPIDFKALLKREEDKKKVIYGLYDSILETNLQSIIDAVGDGYNVRILQSKSGGNILNIQDTHELVNRNCYIKYENVNPHKCFGYTKGEIEEYIQRIVVAFIMEYDK